MLELRPSLPRVEDDAFHCARDRLLRWSTDADNRRRRKHRRGYNSAGIWRKLCGGKISRHRASGARRGERTDRAQTRCDTRGSVARAIFTCHPASPAVSGRRDRARWHRLPADERQAADSTIWILCPSVHSQEVFYESLLNWQPDALFLPEAEFAAVENVLPDPEIAAERLALLMQIERETGPRIIVATRASLDQAAPKRGRARICCYSTPARSNREDGRASRTTRRRSGYERVAQVTTRGQFAVRGGIVDLYSWQAPLPFRLEFFGDQIESLREFDIDTQTSVRDLGRSIFCSSAGATDQSGHVRDYVASHDHRSNR